jgi:hypothetical protein
VGCTLVDSSQTKASKMDIKGALKAHMSKGMKSAHPDKNVKNFKAGGVTSLEAKKYGRNMARVMNQRSKTK